MSKAAPRPVSSNSHGGMNRQVAALALITACIVVSLLLFFGMNGKTVNRSSDRLVTVQEVDAGSSHPSVSPALIGSQKGTGVTSGQQFGSGLTLKKLEPESYPPRFTVAPDSDPAVLAASRLRVGDTLVEVDGRGLDSARVAQLGEELAGLDRVEFAFERDGHVRTRTIVLSSN